MRNTISFSTTIDNYAGVRLYRRGVLINSYGTTYPNFFLIYDNAATSGITYTYQLSLYLGSGETKSASFNYTTP